MNRFLLLAAFLALPCTASAQFFSSPPGLVTTEGYQRCYMFGEWSTARMMFFDGEMKGNLVVMKEVALRHDQTDYYPGNGMGRSWSKVTLDLSDCNTLNLSQTFNSNPTSTPVRAFDGAFSLPTMQGFPANNPASFSISFPLTTPYIYNGTNDLCLDFDFTGGILANSGRWSTGYYQTYYTDSFNGGDSANGTYTKYGTGCTDSGNTNAGQALVFTSVYTNQHNTAAWRNNYRITSRTRYTAKGQNVMHAISLGGNATGSPFPGVTCEDLFLDLNQPYFLFPLAAGTTTQAEAKIDFPLLPHSPAIEGFSFWIQAAWSDSVSGAFKLTDAESSSLPPMPRNYKRWMIYQTDPTQKQFDAIATQGSLVSPFNQATHNPVFRYAQ